MYSSGAFNEWKIIYYFSSFWIWSFWKFWNHNFRFLCDVVFENIHRFYLCAVFDIIFVICVLFPINFSLPLIGFYMRSTLRFWFFKILFFSFSFFSARFYTIVRTSVLCIWMWFKKFSIMNFDEMDIEPKSEPPAGRRSSPQKFAKVNMRWEIEC